MEDKQKLNLLRLAVDNASDYDEAQAYVSFIFGSKEPFATQTPSDGEKDGYKLGYIEPIVEDGVYLVEDEFEPVRFKDVVCVLNPKECNAMVNYHGHKWIVAKNDVSENEMHLLKGDANVEGSSSFYKREVEALNGFDMESCTAHLCTQGLCFKLDDGLRIPTLGQLAAMYLFRKELSKALEMVGGVPMKEKVYWSSSEYGSGESWGVSFITGNVGSWGGKYGTLYARPCRTFGLKKK